MRKLSGDYVTQNIFGSRYLFKDLEKHANQPPLDYFFNEVKYDQYVISVYENGWLAVHLTPKYFK